MLRKVFLLIIKYVLWFTSRNLFNHWLKQTFLFWFENKGAQLFLIWVIFWILILKLSWVFREKIDVSLENNFWLPNSAQPAQTDENSHSFFNVSYTWYKSLIYIKIEIKRLNSYHVKIAGTSSYLASPMSQYYGTSPAITASQFMSAASPTSMAASMYRLDGQSSAHGHMAALQSQYGSVSPSAQSFAGLSGHAPSSNPTIPSIIGAMTW